MSWDSALNTGIRTVDEQHMQLVQKVEGFYQACVDNRGNEHIIEILRFLGAYVKFHFSHEEEMFRDTAYPEKREHKEAHENFIKAFLSIKEQIGDLEPSRFLVEATKKFLTDWLINHISVMDMEFAEFCEPQAACA